MTYRSSLLSAIAGYTAESALRVLLVAIVGIFVARYLGPDQLGLLSVATSIFALLLPLSTLGMRSVLVREFSADERWRPVLIAALSRQVPAAILVSILGAVIVASVRGFAAEASLVALALLPLPLLGVADTLRVSLETSGRVQRIVLIGVFGALLASCLKVGSILIAAPVWIFALIQSVEAGIIALGLVVALRGTRTFGAVRRFYNPILARRLVRESMPLLLSAIAVALYMRVDVVMLGLMAGDETAGIYTAAARLSEVWYFIPVSAAAAIRPRLSNLYSQSKEDSYRLLTQRFVTGAFVVAIVAAALIVVIGNDLVVFLYGSVYAAAGDVLRVHILAAPFVFVGVASSQWFIDRGKTRAVMTRTAIGAALNIALNLLFIPAYGGLGAAMATLVAYAVSAVLLNGISKDTRPLFIMQIRAILLAWR